MWQRPVLHNVSESENGGQLEAPFFGQAGRPTYNRILMRTSPFLGGATSTSSIESGLPASQAMAATHGRQSGVSFRCL